MHGSTCRHLLFLTALILTSSAGLDVQPAEQQSRPVLAVLTQVKGDVRVLSSDRSRKAPARIRQAVAEGDHLELAEGAQVVLLCANYEVLRLDESAGVTAELCGPPAAGGLELNFASLELVGEARGEDREDFDRRPVIVSPRCPADLSVRLDCQWFLDRAPPLRWLEVVGADFYHLELTGPGRFERIRVTAEEAACSEFGQLDGRRLCSLSWPVENWPLVEDREYRLEVVALSGSVSSRSGKTLLQPLPEARARKVHHALEALTQLNFELVTEAVTQAAIYTGSGLVNEAVRSLEPAPEAAASPVLELALGDAYLGIDLPELAIHRYRSALALASDAIDLRREAELRLGRVLGLLGDDSEAAQHLEEARRLGGRAVLHQQVFAGDPSRAQGFRALVVGIDHYIIAESDTEVERTRRFRNLTGAVNDATAMARLLADSYDFDVKLLRDSEATRSAILELIETHLIAPTKQADEVVFYFAGHGSQVTNSKSEEKDKKDETLVPADAARGQPDIRDKELRKLFNRLLDRGARLTVILDSCHSGSGVRGLPGGRQARFLEPMSGDVADGSDPGPPLEDRETLILSAAQDFGSAWPMEDEHGKSHGAFTLSLMRALGAAGPRESAARVFQRARSRLRAEGFQQEPVIAGSERRRAMPLFGGRADTQGASAAVLAVEGDGTVILQGGWATGLSTGSELRRVRGAAMEPEVRIRIVDAELTRSRARVVRGGARGAAPTPRVHTSDLFELERWAVPEEANLRVWVPASDLTSSELLTLGARLARLAEEAEIRWLTDPVADTPTHVLFWRAGTWWLGRGGRRDLELGQRLRFEVLLRALSSEEGAIRLFVNFPLASDLRRGLRLGAGTLNDAIEAVSDPASAIYMLAGRVRQGTLEYAWVRPDVARGDEATSSLPLHTRWVALGESKEAIAALGQELEDLAVRLGRIRAWLTLESPRAGFFPYRLALKNSATRKVKLGDRKLGASGANDGPRDPELDVHRRLAEGEKYGLVLRADPGDVTVPIEPRYVYAFFLDSSGRSTLVFPRGALGSVENHLPGPPSADGDYPIEIPIGRQPVLKMGKPLGIDTYFLLTTSEPIPDPFVLDSDGVRGPDLTRGHPLERLLRNRGVSMRSSGFLTPTTWSIDRVSYEVVPDHDEDG